MADPDTPSPPGTAPTRFWESSGAKVAIVATVGLALMLVRGVIVGAAPSRETVAAAVEGAVWAWLSAVGIQRIDSSSLRWK